MDIEAQVCNIEVEAPKPRDGRYTIFLVEFPGAVDQDNRVQAESLSSEQLL